MAKAFLRINHFLVIHKARKQIRWQLTVSVIYTIWTYMVH